MHWLLNPDLRVPIIGLVGVINVLVEELVATKVIDAQKLAELLETKMRQLSEAQIAPEISIEEQQQQVAVFELVLVPLKDPNRAVLREFLAKPPQGSA